MPRDSFHVLVASLSGPELPTPAPEPDPTEDDPTPVTGPLWEYVEIDSAPVPVVIEPGEPPIRRPW